MMESVCAEVLTFGVLEKPLLYRVSPALEKVLAEGMLVRVPFGRGKVFGVITKVYSADVKNFPFRIREIVDLVHRSQLVGKDLLELILWMKKYYAASYKSLLEAVIPVAIRKSTRVREVAKFYLQRVPSDGELQTMDRHSPKQRALCGFFLEAGETLDRSALKNFSATALSALIEKGIVVKKFERVDRIVYEDFSSNGTIGNGKKIVLTAEQRCATDDIKKSLDSGKFRVHLIHGVTGSGKTEVYLHAIRKVLEADGDVIYLVPELALTPQTVNRIRNGLDLPPQRVVVWHSGLSEGERRDAWLAMACGEAKVVIGARSAIFAPLGNLKIIVVDEEHETTYKQAEMPRYHARDVAVYRAKLCDAVCILGSATPSVESSYNVSTGKYKLNTLSNRIDGSRLPEFEIVDMRYERGSKGSKIVSTRLLELIQSRLENHEQTILFLNRRGYASVVFCDGCDYVATCPHCSTSLTYHKHQNLLRCHICNYVEDLPTACPKCGGRSILRSGIGTQKLADVVGELFPSAKIERIDSDTMGTKDGFYEVLGRFGDGKIDILVGTQMITKGLDFPNVSLVGIINIDNAMNFPDFRANERVFQSIIQVAGRAGRGTKPGIVLIQTHCPGAELIRLALNNDMENFLKNELILRSEFFYPPFSHLIRLIFSGKNETKTAYFAGIFFDYLKKLGNGSFDVRGPAPAPLQKINDLFRFSLMCFSKNVIETLEKIYATVDATKKTDEIAISIDVDPVDMM
jgi:primosomal protein N' (replication factor Y)